MLRKITSLILAAATAVVLAASVGTPASAACRDKTQPGTFKGTGCFTVVQGRA